MCFFRWQSLLIKNGYKEIPNLHMLLIEMQSLVKNNNLLTKFVDSICPNCGIHSNSCCGLSDRPGL